MKDRIKNIAFLLLISFIISSCEDQLDRFPKDKLTPDVFFTNRLECELYTNEYYTIFPDGSGIYDETEDLIVKNRLKDEISNLRTVPATSGSWNWEKLRDMNFFLQHSTNCKDENIRLEFEGLTRFFRAYFYFEKIKRFGDVPWVDRPLGSNDEELYKGRDSRELIMQRILEDIDFAIKYLPAQKETYRVTRWTALALKTRICLFEGTYRKYHGLNGYESILSECVKAGDEFINTSGYTIYNATSTPYLSLFASQNAVASEVILARAYNSSIGLKHDVNGYLTSPTMGKPGMLRNIANMYLMRDGTPFTNQSGWETMSFQEQCANRDLRLSQTIRTPGYKRIGGSEVLPPDFARTYTGYHLIKYVTETKYDTYNASMNDLPLFRTAEVFLNFAEAKAELGTLTQNDIDKTIKLLRDRAGVSNLVLNDANANPDPYLSSEDTGYKNVNGQNKGIILEIRRERTVELIMEGFRYWDIMRWKEGKRFDKPFQGLYFPGAGTYDLDGNGTNDVCLYDNDKPSMGDIVYLKIGTDVILSQGSSGYIVLHSDIKRNWNEERDYLYPVPTDDRVLTQGAISQNPGWNDGLPF